ncbi:hypothetical protein CASFOL_016581 [Castilleja foliolosa]|uniref:Uncharacterized protein n=1 Tax=Castilleja foliolosa TaxID=1961234 RepID=A0ABD3DBR5_9LAMI
MQNATKGAITIDIASQSASELCNIQWRRQRCNKIQDITDDGCADKEGSKHVTEPTSNKINLSYSYFNFDSSQIFK